MKRIAFVAPIAALVLGVPALAASADTADMVLRQCSASDLPLDAVDSCLERARVINQVDPSAQLQSLEARLAERSRELSRKPDQRNQYDDDYGPPPPPPPSAYEDETAPPGTDLYPGEEVVPPGEDMWPYDEEPPPPDADLPDDKGPPGQDYGGYDEGPPVGPDDGQPPYGEGDSDYNTEPPMPGDGAGGY